MTSAAALSPGKPAGLVGSDGESLYALSKRHDISRQLIRVWVQKYEAGAAKSLSGAFDRCIAARTACVVVALPGARRLRRLPRHLFTEK